MEFAVEFKINDGKAEAKPMTIDVEDYDDLHDKFGWVGSDEFLSDHFEIYGIGSVLTIERIK